MELNEARQAIRAIDEEMAELFVRRMEAVKKVAEYKRERGLPVEDRQQEERMSQDLGGLIEDEQLRSFYLRFLKNTVDVSKSWQHRMSEGMKAAYSGAEGAFAHIAAMRIFPDAAPVAYPSFEEAYAAVETGECDVAVLPIENSYAGEVGQVLDLMFSGSLYVNGVYDLSVTQNLLGVPGATIDDVRAVVSHPQALSQCRGYILEHGFEERSAANTALAAREVAEKGDVSLAAVAGRETAELYGLKILDHDINESKDNTTRFAVFSRVENIDPIKRDTAAFLLLFTVKDEVGALAKAINIISAYNYNMRVLRSRPMKDLPWHYFFYAETEGDDATENGRKMISALRGVCPTVKVVGRYTAAGNPMQGGETI